jgi:selenide, water dikinase
LNQNTIDTKSFKLTQYSHGAGCGCKISPKILDSILKNQNEKQFYKNLIVGNEERDDAAVMDLGDGTAIISTTDFFMPIVDDATDFGRIASVNAISDVFAMGGKPIMAIAILGWPIDKLPPEAANAVIEGARLACAEAGIPLAGGHSIDSPEPIFGLAVTGRVAIKNIKKNGGATEGSQLFLTKPLGVGIYTTAQKKGILKAEHAHIAPESMKKLNNIGAIIGEMDFVEAMTDVTGFGLLGHLSEMCEASNSISVFIEFNKVPLLHQSLLQHYLVQKCVPGGTLRNFDSYGHKISAMTDFQKNILCDPQTSGGLLVAVKPSHIAEFKAILRGYDLEVEPFGQFTKRQNHLVSVI